MKFVLVTFATEGPPHDSGQDQTATEEKFRSVVKDHVDVYLAFNPRKLIAIDPAFEESCKDYTDWLDGHPDKQQLGKYNKSWAKIGFSMWKPRLIQHILNIKEIQEGDIVLYHDVNFLKYPQYIMNCEQWRGLSSKILQDLKCDIYFPVGLALKMDVKACLIRKYLTCLNAFEKPGLWAGLIVIKKSNTSIQFMSEWAEIASQLDNVAPLPNPEPHPEFIWHSAEQSAAGILATIWRLNQRLPSDWPRYEIMNRHFSKNNLRRAINSKGEFNTLSNLITNLKKIKHGILKKLYVK